MAEGKIIVYATNWCGSCYQARRVLQKHNVPFEWIDIDQNPAAAQFVKETNHGFRSVPTIVFTDGSILVEPSESALTAKLQQ